MIPEGWGIWIYWKGTVISAIVYLKYMPTYVKTIKYYTSIDEYL